MANSAMVVVALASGGMYTQIIITDANSRGRNDGLRLTVRYSRCGEHTWVSSVEFVHQRSLIIMQTPLPFALRDGLVDQHGVM